MTLPPLGRTLPGLPDVVVLAHADADRRPLSRSATPVMATNAYAVLGDASALYVDAAFDHLLPSIAALAEAGRPPAGLVLTHRHVVPQSDGLADFLDAYDVPVFLGAADARHPQATRSGVRFVDPVGDPVLASFGLVALAFPGHTEGHVVLYREADGVLLAGDTAMGATYAQADRGEVRFVRPHFSFNVDDRALRWGWEAWDQPLSAVLPLHGAPEATASGELRNALLPLQRPEPTVDL